MKKLLLAGALLLSISLSAQKEAEISITNPQPRVNQDVEITLNIEFVRDDFTEQLKNSEDIKISDSLFGFPGGELKKTIKFEKAGKFTIGPIKFNYNGTEYASNTLTVEVAEELPLEEGIWVRVAEMDGQQYLLVEQMTKNKQNAGTETVTTYSSNSTPGSYGEKTNGFIVKKKPTDGISIRSTRTATKTVRPEDSGDFNDIAFSYHISTYLI